MPNKFLPVPILTLAMVIAAWQESSAAEPPTKLDDLLAEYKNLGLPLPTPDARLVRYESGGGFILNGRMQPTTYSLAFELRPGTKEEGPLLLKAAREWRPHRKPNVTEVKPESGAVGDVEVDPDAALALAAQCHARGWDAHAQALLGRGRPTEGMATPTERLVALAWGYWTERLSHPTADRAPAAGRMKDLMKRDPALDTPQNRNLLKSLELALVPGHGKPGSVEAMIDALVDYHADDGSIGEFERDDAYRRIAEKGFEAVPALIAALADDRLTRSMTVGFNNFRSWNMRVGDVAGDLIDGLAGEDLDRGADGKSVGGGWLRRLQGYRVTEAAAKEWWAKARTAGEERYLFDRVVPPAGKKGQTLGPRTLPLHLIVTKYPKRLPELYRTVLEKRPDVQSWPLADAVGEAALPTKDKLDLFASAGTHKNLDHRLPALRKLKGLDAERFDALLLATVEGLPEDVDEAYWRCQEAYVPRLAASSDDPKVWAALEAAVGRASFGLRTEMLHHLSDADGPRRSERLRLLLAHLDDTEVCDESRDKRFGGPGAGFPYDRITAGDAVAVDLGRMVGVEVPTEVDRTAAEWAGVREKVRKAAKAELVKLK